jgi:hypothetical protein
MSFERVKVWGVSRILGCDAMSLGHIEKLKTRQMKVDEIS